MFSIYEVSSNTIQKLWGRTLIISNTEFYRNQLFKRVNWHLYVGRERHLAEGLEVEQTAVLPPLSVTSLNLEARGNVGINVSVNLALALLPLLLHDTHLVQTMLIVVTKRIPQ